MKQSESKRILIVEDEMHIAEGLKLNLSIQGYHTRIATDGVSALKEWKDWQPDLIVLDIMLPVLDGLSVLQSIRLVDDRIPILILSAKGAPDDRVKGLSLGCDDYLIKPFNLEEFLLRAERLMTKAVWTKEKSKTLFHQPSSLLQEYSFGNNRINFQTHTATCKDGEITLTEQEIRLMKLFVLSRGKPLSRKQLLEIGWGYSASTSTRTVDNFVVRLRKYFEDDPRNPKFFKSVRSVGYLFDDGESDSNTEPFPES